LALGRKAKWFCHDFRNDGIVKMLTLGVISMRRVVTADAKKKIMRKNGGKSLRRAWVIMDGNIAYRLRNSQPLPETEFPWL
jgi:hypothetical protein